MLSSNVVALSHDSTAGAFASFVLDKRGNEIHADSGNLQAALAHQASFTSDLDNVKGSLSSLWVTVNRSAVAVYFNFDGPKIASFESTDGFASAAVVTRFGCTVLVICSRNRTLTILSLPDLNQIARMPFTAAVQYVHSTFSHPAVTSRLTSSFSPAPASVQFHAPKTEKFFRSWILSTFDYTQPLTLADRPGHLP